VEYILDNVSEHGFKRLMSSKQQGADRAANHRNGGRKPVWADGLRRMYDEVVEESLPDDFVDLLKKLDDASGS